MEHGAAAPRSTSPARRAVLGVATACVLTGPTALAFFSGGYFSEPRLVAAIVTWTLVLAAAICGPAPLPRGAPGRLALAALAALAAWSALSSTWAPLAGPAIQNVERLVLYVGALMLTIAVVRVPRALRAVEPALAAGATIVIGYGLAGRLLPGVVELARSQSAGGRLEQPITYWNAEGALAAVGLILCARVAGDRMRSPALRTLAVAATAPLGAGVYLTYSRGAIAVGLLGLVILVALARSRSQLLAAGGALATGVAAAAATAGFPGVASLEGASSDRIRDGAIVLALLVLIALGAGLLAARGARRQPRSPADDDAPRWIRRLGPIAAIAVACVAVGLAIGGIAEKSSPSELAEGARPGRLASVSSNRYEYWRVGLQAFERDPVIGVGSGGFRVEWLRERSIREAVTDAHSLEVEIAAELGAIGLLLFAAMLAGVVAAARRALQRDHATAAGSCAALIAWFLHASIDWDWQLPAVTLPAIVLAGTLIVLAETAPQALAEPAAAESGAPRPALSATAGR